jgi:hypothetical protein
MVKAARGAVIVCYSRLSNYSYNFGIKGEYFCIQVESWRHGEELA